MGTRMTRNRKKTGPWPISVERTVPAPRTAKKRCRRKFPSFSPTAYAVHRREGGQEKPIFNFKIIR
jgi:hypothetical protein